MSDTPYTVSSAAREPAAEVPHDGAPTPLSQRVRSLRLPSQHAGGGSRLGWIAWVLCLLFAGSTAVLGYLLAVQKPAAEAGADKKDASSAVATSLGGSPPGEIALQGKGYVIPAHQILVSPKVTGEIKRLNIVEGTRVQKGAILAELETTDYDADVRRAESALQAARLKWEELKRTLPEEQVQVRKEMEEAEAQWKQLRLAHERNLKLRQANENVHLRSEPGGVGERAIAPRSAASSGWAPC